MLVLLTLACGTDCKPGFVEVDGTCVPYSSSDTDPTDPTGTTPTDSGTPTPTDPGASPGHYACPDGFGHAFTGPALRGLCGTCDSLTCTWTVFTVDDAGDVGFVEMDLYDAGTQSGDAWREYHDAFTLGLDDADGSNWSIALAQILEPDDYESNTNSWVDPRNPDTAAGLSAQANAFDTEGTFLDCFAWGPDAADVFGDGCSVVP